MLGWVTLKVFSHLSAPVRAEQSHLLNPSLSHKGNPSRSRKNMLFLWIFSVPQKPRNFPQTFPSLQGLAAGAQHSWRGHFPRTHTACQLLLEAAKIHLTTAILQSKRMDSLQQSQRDVTEHRETTGASIRSKSSPVLSSRGEYSQNLEFL